MRVVLLILLGMPLGGTEGAAEEALRKQGPPPAPPAAKQPAVAGYVQADEILVKEGYRTAIALRAAGDPSAALAVLRVTYERVKTPFLLRPIAELSLQLHRPLDGLAALSEYRARLSPQEIADQDHGGSDAVTVEQLETGLRAQVARLQVRTDKQGALVLLDGKEQGRTPLPKPIEVDPGEHEVVARGDRAAAETVRLSPGQELTVVLGPFSPQRRSWAKVARFTLLGVALAALGSGTALLLANGTCAGGKSCGPDLKTPGAALLGVGFGMGSATAVMFVLDAQRQASHGTQTWH